MIYNKHIKRIEEGVYHDASNGRISVFEQATRMAMAVFVLLKNGFYCIGVVQNGVGICFFINGIARAF